MFECHAKTEDCELVCIGRRCTHTVCFPSNRITPSAPRGVSLASCSRALTATLASLNIEGREKDRQHLFAVLQQNDYPRTFIERTLHRIECKKERVEMEENKEQQPVVVLPYVEGVSWQIAEVLSQLRKDKVWHTY